MACLLRYEIEKYTKSGRFRILLCLMLLAAALVTVIQSREGAYETEPLSQTAYEQYRTGLIDEAEQRMQIGLFADEDTYSYRNAKRIVNAYRSCENVQISAQCPAGVQLLCDSTPCDGVLVLWIVLLLYMIVLEERKSGQFSFQRTTKYGRRTLGNIKLLTLMLFVLGGVIMICLERLVLVLLLYGPFAVDASIQSFFPASVCAIPVGGVLLLAFLIKCAYCVILALGLYLITQLVTNNLKCAWVWMLCLLGTFLLYVLLEENSWLALLKELNPWSFLNASRLFTRFKNLNILNVPIPFWTMYLCLNLAGATVLLAPSVCLYGRRNIMPVKNAKKGCLPWRRHANVFLHEGYKLLTMGGWRLVLLVMLLGICLTDEQYQLYGTMAQYYDWSYSQRLEGIWGEQQEQFLKEEEERLSSIITLVQENPDAISALSGQYDVYNAYIRMTVKANRIRTIDHASFLYENGYALLFIHTNPSGYIQHGVLLLVLLIFSMSLVWEMEYHYRLMALLAVTKAGVRTIRRNKRRWCLIMGALLYLGTCLPMYVRVFQTFGFLKFDVPAPSLDILAGVPEWISIGALFALQNAACLLLVEALGLIICAAMKKFMGQVM